MVKKSVKICKECEKEIDLSIDKHVLLGTYSGEKTDDESYFHFKCFVSWYNKKVSEKAKNSVGQMQGQVQKLISNPQIAGLLANVKGIGKIKDMLGTNLNLNDGNLNQMVADFMGDDPATMKEGTITPLPKKDDQNGKPKKRSTRKRKQKA